jgi:phospholipid-transporting ATPase
LNSNNTENTISLHRPESQPLNTRQRTPRLGIKDIFNRLIGRTTVKERIGERIIYVNNTELNDQQRFLHNRVFTAKYTVITFLPKFLYEEFSKYANLFFLFISGIQVRCTYLCRLYIDRFISKFPVFHLLQNIQL